MSCLGGDVSFTYHLWFLQITGPLREGFNTNISFRTQCSTVSQSLHSVQLWISMSIPICWKIPLWGGVSDTMIYITILTQVRMAVIKKQMTVHAGNDWEKEEYLLQTESENWYIHYGNWYGGSSKIWIWIILSYVFKPQVIIHSIHISSATIALSRHTKNI